MAVLQVGLFCLPSLSPLTPHGSFKPRQVRNVMTTSQPSHSVAKRQSANYQPSIWSHQYMQLLKNNYADDLYKARARKLEEEVRCMINNNDLELLTTLELIDDIQRLGLGYKFEGDITMALHRFVAMKGCSQLTSHSIHDTALSFRLLRQHGFEVSQDVFKSFKDEDGNFKACISKDVKGMLSLYEASYLGFEGEDLLDEAMVFTSMHLENLKENTRTRLRKQVRHALELPLHRRMRMLETRWFIELYDTKETANPLLLELAKLDFNILQSLLQRDLKDMST